MNATIGDLPYWEVSFDKDGKVLQDDGLAQELAGTGVRDLFFFSHGWNNSPAGAREMYQEMFSLVSAALTPEQRATTGIVGILWPSLLFPEDGPPDPQQRAAAPAAQAAVPEPAAPDGVATESTGLELASALAPAFPGQEQDLQTLGALLDSQPQDGAELDRFHRLAAGLVTTVGVGGPEDNGERTALEREPRAALTALADSPGAPPSDTQGDNLFERAWHGARELLRTASYYEMKNRAGVVGRDGLGKYLVTLQSTVPELRVHLMGHSFGARLVAYALDGLPESAMGRKSPVKSVFLVQGAFSHFAFSPSKPGALHERVDRVDGPLLATFSAHDRAVALWYPSASRLARQDNQGLEDFGFQWGGMGYDGYQQDDVVPLTLGPPGTPYPFSPGVFYRLDANDVVKASLSAFSEAHCDILHPEIAWAAVRAAGLGSAS